MELSLRYGLKSASVRVDPRRWFGGRRFDPHASIASPDTLIQNALATPHDFPPLAQALTEGDHIAIVAEGPSQHFKDCLAPVMECLHAARIPDENVTIVVPPGSDGREIVASDVNWEEHQPGDPRRLAYLATTKSGRRIYLNRTVIDADQVIVLSDVRYRVGRAIGGIDRLYPALSDVPTRAVDAAKLAMDVDEVGWLLGLPMFVYLITDADGRIVEVVAGPASAWPHVEAKLQRYWLAHFDQPGDLVIATLTGTSKSHTTAELVSALTEAAAVAKAGGTIMAIFDAAPEIGPAFQAMTACDSPTAALKLMHSNSHADLAEARQWLNIVRDHRVLILCRWREQLVEDLFATPLANFDQVQRVIDEAGDCLFIADAHRTRAELHGGD